MINFWIKPWEHNDIWAVDIYANGDLLTTLAEYPSKEQAEKAAEAFIYGFKFAKGE